ncbi:DUF5330 domain-containing protein [Cohaesibacter celericrescens]|uniref:DUF5330 domain-containing protein n=1 Tax=Cohaesibacter celericrescens TaxID=2067669 RepID=A0A2N5XRB0_9HYPH|nr:DUF5330 domain-containing protein [Cohaesibacter celericrescens]PLW76977.1 hypothetical protein C0081_13105 [Cohaesibacter celericrescens]
MSFLIRAAFWLSLVILILPADPGTEANKESLSTTDAFIAAQATLSDFTSFCARQPDVCAAGEVAIDSFSAKARYGAKQLYVYLDGQSEDIASTSETGLTQTADISQDQTLDQQQLTALVQDLKQ